MMATIDYWQASVLAFIQGVTEFLPISSSAHLLLPSQLLGWSDQGLAFDVAVHLGTLLAVLSYFSRDLLAMGRACCLGMAGRDLAGKEAGDLRMVGLLVIATIPVVLVGLLARSYIENTLRELPVIIAATLFFALLLWYADRRSTQVRGLRDIGWRNALFVGLAQVLALIPGTSRAGITMTAALFCGFEREAAGRFSFLLSIPVIAGASLLLILDLLEQSVVDWSLLLYALLFSAVVAYLCIHYFLRVIARVGFLPFIIYRLLLGILLLGMAIA